MAIQAQVNGKTIRIDTQALITQSAVVGEDWHNDRVEIHGTDGNKPQAVTPKVADRLADHFGIDVRSHDIHVVCPSDPDVKIVTND